MLINPALYKLAYETSRDFTAVSQLASAPYLLVVHDAVRAKNVHELVTLAQAQPGVLTYGSPGNGSTPHLAAELFKSTTGIDIRHIPYKGVGPAVPDLVAGRISIMFSPIATGLPLVREGKLRALAVTSAKRSPAAPEIPSISEVGYRNFDVTGWLALVAPARTPRTVLRALHVEVGNALAREDVRVKLAALGLEPLGSSPDELEAVMKSGLLQWATTIRRVGIKPD